MKWRKSIQAACFAALLCGALAQGADLQYREQYRPQYHFSPLEHWMNDPNGLVYSKGQYHLFYQYHPFGMTWGPMHWGHAVSPDMIHWRNLPIALYPDQHGMIFSGSAVEDRRNSSGLGSLETPPLVAIYTSHDAAAAKSGRTDFQNQSLAYSLDAGRTWIKYPGNPVLRNPGRKDFRDPKISWFEPAARWIMTLAVGDHVSFFSSSDLRQWAHESDFGVGWGAHHGVWECPDLIAMKITGESAPKYVLLVSVNPGGPNGGSGTQYFVGDFDGHDFKLDDAFRARLQRASEDASDSTAMWVDYGTDDYAGVTWSGVPRDDGRTLFLGWMSNWQYAQKVPTTPWRSAMTVPRELHLVRTAQGLELRSRPVAELASLRDHSSQIREQAIVAPLDLSKGVDLRSGLSEIALDIDLRDARLVTLEFANQIGQKTLFKINKALERYELDRAQSGEVSFDPQFGKTEIAPMHKATGKISIHAFLDRSSLELFLNEGETVMTSVQFPSVPYDNLRLWSDKPAHLVSATTYQLKSIWTDK